MENKEWEITGWSLPDFRMVHIIIKNTQTGKEESKTYKNKGSFYSWMSKHGLFNSDAIKIAHQVW